MARHVFIIFGHEIRDERDAEAMGPQHRRLRSYLAAGEGEKLHSEIEHHVMRLRSPEVASCHIQDWYGTGLVMVLKSATVTDLTSSDHRFRQIARIISTQIANGEIARGSRLMSERDLGKHFNVSRVTIRRALLDLQERGLIEAEGARGWFVTSALGEPNALMGFSEMARARGLKPQSRVLKAEVRAATLDEAERLGIAPGQNSSISNASACSMMSPVGHERSRVVLEFAPELAQADFATASLYDELRKFGVVAHSADYVLQGGAADDREAELLDVVIGAPLLIATATTHMQSGKAMELSHSIFRSDRYRFRTTLFRSGWK